MHVIVRISICECGSPQRRVAVAVAAQVLFIKKFENAQTETYTKAYAAVLQIYQERYRQFVSDAVATETADQKEERLARCLQAWLDEDEVLLPSKKNSDETA